MSKQPEIDRRKRPKSAVTVATVLSVAALSFGPILLMARSLEDRLLIFLTCLPLSGLSFAWLWRERRRIILRWAAICFAAAVFCWLLLLLYFVFETRDEARGEVLIAANAFTNCILFLLLNRTWKKRRVRAQVEREMVVV